MHNSTDSSRKKYISIVEEINRELGCAAPDVTHDMDVPLTLDIEVDSVQFQVMHSIHCDHEDIRLVCHYGEAPAETVIEKLTDILQRNKVSAQARGPTFGALQENRRIVQLHNISLNNLTAASLLSVMKIKVAEAKLWKGSLYFGSENDVEKVSSSILLSFA